MSEYYGERAIIMLFLAKSVASLSKKEKITALINIIDENTLKCILNLKPQEQSMEAFQQVIKFIKDNQTDIITQLNAQNLFYSRINLALALPTFVIYISALSLMATPVFPLALVLGVALIAGVAMVINITVCSGIVYDGLTKKHLYEKIANKPTHQISNGHGFFDNPCFLSIETTYTLCNLPEIFGINGLH